MKKKLGMVALFVSILASQNVVAAELDEAIAEVAKTQKVVDDLAAKIASLKFGNVDLDGAVKMLSKEAGKVFKSDLIAEMPAAGQPKFFGSIRDNLQTLQASLTQATKAK